MLMLLSFLFLQADVAATDDPAAWSGYGIAWRLAVLVICCIVFFFIGISSQRKRELAYENKHQSILFTNTVKRALDAVKFPLCSMIEHTCAFLSEIHNDLGESGKDFLDLAIAYNKFVVNDDLKLSTNNPERSVKDYMAKLHFALSSELQKEVDDFVSLWLNAMQWHENFEIIDQRFKLWNSYLTVPDFNPNLLYLNGGSMTIESLSAMKKQVCRKMANLYMKHLLNVPSASDKQMKQLHSFIREGGEESMADLNGDDMDKIVENHLNGLDPRRPDMTPIPMTFA